MIDISLQEIRERYRPHDQPFQREWDELHKLHVALLGVDSPVALREACHIADAKYEVYSRWVDWRWAKWSAS